MFITLLGRPGAGKTTLGMELEERLDLPYIGGGALLAAWVRDRRDGWEQIERHLRDRIDTPPDLQLAALDNALGSRSTGAILDGFPKTVALHAKVEDLLGEKIALAIYLETPAEIATYRIAHRLACDVCRQPASDLDLPEHGPCPKGPCDGQLGRRVGDQTSDHTREAADSVALRDVFDQLDRLLTVPAHTTVAQRVRLVLEEIEYRSKGFSYKLR